MNVIFEPYIKSGAPFRWAYSFFSPALRRSYYYSCFPGSPVKQVGPGTAEPASTLLRELPWVACPGWLNTLREACNQVGPLAHAEQTGCRVFVSAAVDGQPHWRADFKDGATGHSFNFEWTSPGDLRLVYSTKG